MAARGLSVLGVGLVAAATVLFVLSARNTRSSAVSGPQLASADSGSRIALNVQPMWIPAGAATKPGVDFWGWTFFIPVTTSAGDPPASTPPLWTMIDSGSSLLAFCDRKPFEPLAVYAPEGRMEYDVDGAMRPAVACANYGGGCCGWWGFFYHNAQTSVPSTDGKPVLLSPGGAVSIMKEEKNMLCSTAGFTMGGGTFLSGIFGIGGRKVSSGYFYRDPALVTVENCADRHNPNFIEKWMGPPNPLRDHLSTNPALTKLALHWSGQIGEGAGQMFLEGAAEANEHYNPSALIGPVTSNFEGYFALNVTGFEVLINGVVVLSHPFNTIGIDTGYTSNAILDTGNPTITFPAPFLDALRAGWDDVYSGGIVNVVMGTPDGLARLPFGVAQLKQVDILSVDGGLIKGANNTFMFGAIGFLFFDLVVFDMVKSLTTFVQRDPTKFFVPTSVPARPTGP